MFKTLKTILAGILAAVIVVAIGAGAYTVFAAPDANVRPTTTNGYGNGGNGTGAGVSVLDIPASDLGAEEAASLLFMREEEKLARDVLRRADTRRAEGELAGILLGILYELLERLDADGWVHNETANDVADTRYRLQLFGCIVGRLAQTRYDGNRTVRRE